MAGRPTKLTPEIQQTIVEILRNCGSRIMAAGRTHINYATFVEWIRRGERATSGRYYDFLIAVRDAEAQAELMATRTICLAIVGGWYKVPMRDKDGNYTFRRDPMTGEILRDAHGRPDAELADAYMEPDAARAAWYLERRDPANWGRGGTGMTMNVNPPPSRPNPGKKESLNLFDGLVQILIDNRIPLPQPRVLEHQGQKAIETTGTLGEAPAHNRLGVESMSDQALDYWMTSHVAHAEQAEKYETIRAAGVAFAEAVRECTPPSGEQRAAIRKIREAMYNAAMACGEK